MWARFRLRPFNRKGENDMRTIQQIESEISAWKALQEQQREAIQNISISAFRSIAGLKKEEQLAELYISQLEEELDAMTE